MAGVWIINYNLYPRQFKKKNSILTHIAKKLQARQFSQYCLFEKASSSKKFFFKFFYFFEFPITVSVIDLTFVWSVLSINLSLFYIETQILKQF